MSPQKPVIALVAGVGIFKWDYRAVLFGFLAGSNPARLPQPDRHI